MTIIETLQSFETSVVVDESTGRHNSDNPNLQQHSCEKLKSQNPQQHVPRSINYSAYICLYKKKRHPDLMKSYDKVLKFLSQFDNNHDEKVFFFFFT